MGFELDLDGDEPSLLESCDRGRRPAGPRRVQEWLASPRGQRTRQGVHGRRRLAGGEGSASGCQTGLEGLGIELAALDAQLVATAPSQEPVSADRLAQLRHIPVQGLLGGAGRLALPQVLDEARSRHDPVRVDEQAEQQGSGLGGPERDRATILLDLQRSEDLYLHGGPLSGTDRMGPSRDCAASCAAASRDPRSRA